MSDFKFSCPKCQEGIIRDMGQANWRISCPACQQIIIVPQPTASPLQSWLEITKFKLKKGAGILLSSTIVIVLIAIAFFLTARPQWSDPGSAYVALSLPRGPSTLSFQASVDGTDMVKLRDHEFWIEHRAFKQPTDILVDDALWRPAWNEDQYPFSATAPYDLTQPFKPGDPAKIKLFKYLGRGTIDILEMPTPENKETLTIQLDDGPMGGADTYAFTISW